MKRSRALLRAVSLPMAVSAATLSLAWLTLPPRWSDAIAIAALFCALFASASTFLAGTLPLGVKFHTYPFPKARKLGSAGVASLLSGLLTLGVSKTLTGLLLLLAAVTLSSSLATAWTTHLGKRPAILLMVATWLFLIAAAAPLPWDLFASLWSSEWRTGSYAVASLSAALGAGLVHAAMGGRPRSRHEYP